MTQLEGDAYSKLNAMFAEGTNAADRAAKIELATVTSDAPNLAIRLDSDGMPLDKDDLIVAEQLTKHKRTVIIAGGGEQEVEFQDELKSGDRVLVACVDADMTYIIIDRARFY